MRSVASAPPVIRLFEPITLLFPEGAMPALDVTIPSPNCLLCEGPASPPSSWDGARNTRAGRCSSCCGACSGCSGPRAPGENHRPGQRATARHGARQWRSEIGVQPVRTGTEHQARLDGKGGERLGGRRSVNAGGLAPPAPTRTPNMSRPTNLRQRSLPRRFTKGSTSATMSACSSRRSASTPPAAALDQATLFGEKPAGPCSDPRRPRRRRAGPGGLTVAELDGAEHGIDRPSPTLRAGAVHRLDDFRLHASMKQIHPLVRSIENPRIVPGQTT